MGMKIFESSGTFTPTDYGLGAGDVLDIICIGGGASGGSGQTGYGSVAGTASSFGSYVSSADGAVMSKGGSGGGGGGYLPGVPFYGGNGGFPVGLAGTMDDPVSPYCNPGGPGNKGATGSSEQLGPFPGGNGYGAGGGGVYSSSDNPVGGDGGKIAFGSCVLPSTSGITVTVGAGGVNGGNSSVHGAPGVVIVFW